MLVYNTKDFVKIKECASKCKPIESYELHIYKIIARYLKASCFLAEKDSKTVGFVMGFVSDNIEGTYFIWQIGVDLEFQGQGLGSAILKEVEKEIKKLGSSRIELTIDPENTPSQKLFEKNGYKNISTSQEFPVKTLNNDAVKDFYGPGRHFMLYEKKI
jgi:diaminobutyrate acetyltransferase